MPFTNPTWVDSDLMDTDNFNDRIKDNFDYLNDHKSDLDSIVTLDTGNNRIGINESNPDTALHITGTGEMLKLEHSDDADSHLTLNHADKGLLKMHKHSASGFPAVIRFNVVPVDTTSNARYDFFRETDTSGNRQLYIYKGDGSDTLEHVMGVGSADTYFYADGDGAVGIGTDSPTQRLHVRGGDARIDRDGMSSNLTVLISADAGYSRYLQFETSGSRRWSLGTTQLAETGSDAGSDFGILRFSDAGSFLDTVFKIFRNTGSTLIRNALRIGGTTEPNATLHTSGSTILGVASAAVAAGNMGNGEVNLWVDEGTDELTFQVKYSNGTVKSGAVSLS